MKLLRNRLLQKINPGKLLLNKGLVSAEGIEFSRAWNFKNLAGITWREK
jgi:hypothetical protein